MDAIADLEFKPIVPIHESSLQSLVTNGELEEHYQRIDERIIEYFLYEVKEFQDHDYGFTARRGVEITPQDKQLFLKRLRSGVYTIDLLSPSINELVCTDETAYDSIDGLKSREPKAYVDTQRVVAAIIHDDPSYIGEITVQDIAIFKERFGKNPVEFSKNLMTFDGLLAITEQLYGGTRRRQYEQAINILQDAVYGYQTMNIYNRFMKLQLEAFMDPNLSGLKRVKEKDPRSFVEKIQEKLHEKTLTTYIRTINNLTDYPLVTSLVKRIGKNVISEAELPLYLTLEPKLLQMRKENMSEEEWNQLSDHKKAVIESITFIRDGCLKGQIHDGFFDGAFTYEESNAGVTQASLAKANIGEITIVDAKKDKKMFGLLLMAREIQYKYGKSPRAVQEIAKIIRRTLNNTGIRKEYFKQKKRIEDGTFAPFINKEVSVYDFPLKVCRHAADIAQRTFGELGYEITLQEGSIKTPKERSKKSLLNILTLPRSVEEFATQSKTGPHQWNTIQIGGVEYLLDTVNGPVGEDPEEKEIYPLHELSSMGFTYFDRSLRYLYGMYSAA